MHGRRLASLCCMRDTACVARSGCVCGTPLGATSAHHLHGLSKAKLGMRGFCQDIAKRHSDFDRSRLIELEHKKLDDPGARTA